MLRGADLTTVQRKVGCPADGVYGPVTKAHVRAFQSRHGLAADGIVGALTAAALGIGRAGARAAGQGAMSVGACSRG